MTELIHRLHGHHEPQEEWAFHAIVEILRRDTPAPVMIELGSFWAYYSLWLKTAVPATTCVLVEPDPQNLAAGLENFRINQLDAAHRVQAAVGLPHGGLAEITWESDGQKHPTPLVSVDGLLADLQLERVDVVLCDAQGAEVDAIRGLAEAVKAGRLRFLVISTHHHAITGDPLTHQRCLDELEGLGVGVIVEHTVHEGASGDGLIASADARDAALDISVSRVRTGDTIFGPLEPELAAAQAALDRLRSELAAARLPTA